MKKQHSDYKVVPFSKVRRVMVITLRSAQRKPTIHGLIEVDVTSAREFLQEHKARTGESLSFTAFIITCLAKAVDANKSVQACRKGSKHLILFDEVDVAQVEAVEKAWVSLRDFRFIPVVIFRFIWPIFWWMLGRYPRMQKRYGGTVGLTAVGMFGKGSGWGIPVEYRTLGITLGGIAEKPGVVDGQIAIREYLCMTLSFNHDLIDGAPAARFIAQLKELIESGYGLNESEIKEPIVTR